jgi:hypothetical protein
MGAASAFAQGYGGLNWGQHGLPRQRGGASLVTPRDAQRNGLVRKWFTAMEVDRAHGEVAYINQGVSYARGYLVFDVEAAGKRVKSYSEREINTFGEMIGEEEARLRAEKYAAEYAAAFPEAKDSVTVVKRKIPEVTLFASTMAGMVHAIDGETGRTRWSAQYGKLGHPTLSVASNDEVVAVINGMRLYVANRDDGKLIFEKLLNGVPGAGAALSDEMVFVPTLSGFVEAYQLKDPDETTVTLYNTAGKIEVRPTVSSSTVSWPTSDGKVYTANANTVGIRTRRELGDNIQAPTVVHPPNLLFAAAADGFVECLDELRLTPIWRFSTGEAVLHPLVIAGGDLYIVTESGGMYRVDPKTGNEYWWSPGVTQFISASQERVYCADEFGRLSILDRSTGGQLGLLPTQAADVKLINPHTDRIFLGSRTGLLQCLHESALDRPLVHFPEPKKKPPPPPVVKPGARPSTPAATPEDTEETPFGGAEEDGAADVDPFGEEAMEGDEAAEPDADAEPEAEAGADEDPFGEP